MISPALILLVKSLPTLAVSAILSSATPASTTMPSCNFDFMSSAIVRNALPSMPCKLAISTFCPLISCTLLIKSLAWLLANFCCKRSSCFSRSRVLSVIWLTRSAISSRFALSWLASWLSCFSPCCTYLTAPMPVTASIRRMPAAIPCSLTILNKPISPVRCTCRPPHSSMEKGLPSLSTVPIDNTRTVSPYFSPNSAIAPLSCACVMLSISTVAGWLARICWLTMFSMVMMSCSVKALSYEKSKRNTSLLTNDPFWVTPVPRCSRRAACSRWVAEWFLALMARTWLATRASLDWPWRILPILTTPWWMMAWPDFLVSWTSNTPVSVWMSPNSPAWPPPSA